MSLEIYKKGQGKTARISAYVLVGILILFGAERLYAEFNVEGKGVLIGETGMLWGDNPPLVQSEVPLLGSLTVMMVVAFIAFCLGLLALHLVLNGPKMAGLLIDTEQEMRKVSWPSKSEVQNATIVVVVVTFVMAMALFWFDKGLQGIFQFIF